MELNLSIGGITFRLDFEREINVNPEYANFIVSEQGAPQNPDITARFTWDWQAAPEIQGEPTGTDLLHYHYLADDRCLCVTRGGYKGAVACTAYSPNFSKVICYINEAPFLVKLNNLASFMRMLPLCRIFTHFGVLFFHAAQIGYRGKGILFTAPSGTGKTTQARLWESSRGAEILCNDRTLVRKSGGEWQTCGFPLDGSTPVANNRTCPLRAIVYLEQGSQCRCERLSPSKALLHLMPQMVIDGWDPQIRAECMRQLLSLMEKIPVYRLVCTPDVRAVEALELQLSKE